MEAAYLPIALVLLGVLLGFLGVFVAVWLQNQTEPEDKLQRVPVVPRATLPIHETGARVLKKIKAAEPEPEQLVEKDFDPEGAEQTRNTRLRELIRATQTRNA